MRKHIHIHLHDASKKHFTASAEYRQWKQEVRARYPYAEFELNVIGVVAHDDGSPIAHFNAAKMTGSID